MMLDRAPCGLFLCLGFGLFGGRFLSGPKTGFLRVVLSHELTPLSFSVEFVFLVIALGAGVSPDHALGLGVGDVPLSRSWSRFYCLLGGVLPISGLGGGHLGR